MLKYKSATKQEDSPKTVHKIIESLRGDAFQVAMDLAIDKLSEKNGIPTLISLIKQQCFPTKALEAKELYSQGHRTGGMLSRQNGESMLSYISRRRRWWRLLSEMDPELGLSDEIRGAWRFVI